MGAKVDAVAVAAWALTRPLDLIWRDWEHSGAVYDAGSGDTHVMGVLGIELLSMLMAGPRTEADMQRELSGEMPDALDVAEAAFHMGSQLRQLERLGLVEPVTIVA